MSIDEQYLTLRWNNALTALLGIPTVLYTIMALSSSTLSDRDAFIGMVLLGAFY